MDQQIGKTQPMFSCPPQRPSKKWYGLTAFTFLVIGYLVLQRTFVAAPTVVAPDAPPFETVSLGAVLPLTGEAATLGLPLKKSIELAVERLNAAGSGKKIAMVFEDGKCDEQQAAIAAKKLIEVDKVMAIIGGACSGEVLGLAPLVNEKKVITISPSATSPDLTTKGGPYVYRFAPSDALAGKVAAAYAINDRDFKRVAVISENTEYAQGLRKTFINSFKLLGGEVAVDEVYATGVTDFRAQALKVKNAEVEAVYLLPQTPAAGLAILSALSDQQVKAARLTAEVLLNRGVVKAQASRMEELVGLEPSLQEDAPAFQAFMQAYKDAHKEELAYPFFMSNAYSEVFLLKELFEKHQGNAQNVRDELDHLKDWSGGSVSGITLDQSGDIQWRLYTAKEVKRGVVESVRAFTLE